MQIYVRARVGHAPLSEGALEEEWGEEPELYYISGPAPTLAWVAQVILLTEGAGGTICEIFGQCKFTLIISHDIRSLRCYVHSGCIEAGVGLPDL